MRFLIAATLLASCAHPTPAPAPTPAPEPATHVVVIEPGVPVAVMKGPFVVLTINPGSDMDLGLSATGTCEDATWFAYSGGGAAVGPGQTLCARSRAGEAVTHGFSGYD